MADNKNDMTVYNLITLNAENMVGRNGYHVEHDKNHGNWQVHFRYDLPPTRKKSGSNEIFDRDVILNEKEQPDCALFYQLVQCLCDEEKNVDDPEDILRQSIVYVDFEKVFKNKRFKINTNLPVETNVEITASEKNSATDNKNNNEYKSRKADELKGDSGIGYRLEWMFDPDNGIELSFDGKPRNDKTKKWKKFVSFEKSSSMSRNCLITFVDSELKARVENRLLLDIDFSNIKVVSSKYYAYRGLYLSSGYRIEQQKEADTFVLNQETVIVLDDEKGKLKRQKVFSASNINPYDENNPWTFAEQTENIYPNIFDGEGLICPSYAKYISTQLIQNYGFTNDSFSFQIRMPFTKGMLHKVDFNKFLAEQLSSNQAITITPEKLLVKDVFGIKRDLKKAKIILTKSMFKCCSWLKKWCSQNKITDPMAYYFQKVNGEYRHALYITNTDARFSDEDQIPLNYQFFSTLNLEAKDFEALIEKHIERIKAVPKEITKNRNFIEQDDIDDAETLSDEDSMAKPQRVYSVWKKCLKALAKNEAFIDNPKVKRYIEIEQQRLATNLCMGRLNVTGEQRFFSSDLLALLRCIYKRYIFDNVRFQPLAHVQINDLKQNRIKPELLPKQTTSVMKLLQAYRKQLKALQKHSLVASRFYMPKKAIEIKTDDFYLFLRNPHLSRNEECILKPLYSPVSKLYNNYFSDLKGIVMVSCDSMVPMALSGADFDGDMVKIIYESTIVEAVKNSVYQKNKKDGKTHYERSLPVVVIPSVTAVEETDHGSIPFSTIKNTFSNHIGLVSNIAIKLSKKEYSKNSITPKEMERGICCPACTVVTGIEIDAAKTGVHPKANIDSLQNSVAKQDIFLAAKKALKAIDKKHYSPIVKLNGDATLSLYLTKDEKSAVDGMTDIPFITAADCTADSFVPNIDWLPGRYLKCIKDIAEGEAYRIHKNKSTVEKKCFTFQEEDKWAKTIEKDKKQKLGLLVEAYLKIRKLNTNLNKAKALLETQNFYGHIKTLLKIQYDDTKQELTSNVTLDDAIEQAYDAVYAIIVENAKAEFEKQVSKDNTTINDFYREECKNVLARLKEVKWQYTKRNDRKDKLISILAVKKDSLNQLTPATIELLTNFQNGGYMILFYILIDIQTGFYADIDSTAYIKMEKMKSKPRFTAPENNEYFINLYNTYVEYSERKQTEWNKQIVKKCRKELKKIFEKDMNMALKYVYALPRKNDSQQDFLWNMFTDEEIMNNIIAVEKNV